MKLPSLGWVLLRSSPSPATGCWIWRKTPLGEYGRVWWDGKVRLAHRLVWELVNGPIPVDMCVDHLCFERRCVRPGHLQLLTRGANSKRRRTKVLGIWGCGHPRKDNTYRHPKTGTERCQSCHRANALAHYHRTKESAQ